MTDHSTAATFPWFSWLEETLYNKMHTASSRISQRGLMCVITGLTFSIHMTRKLPNVNSWQTLII
jgi:hypothetical protein